MNPFVDSNRLDSLRRIREKPARFRRYGWIVAILTPMVVSGPDITRADDLASAFGNATIIVEARKYACYRFDVYLATNRDQQMRGLMHVRHLPEFAGMLFVYDSPDMHSMWMKNTYISLDILFIREDGTIANIAANTEPLSLKSITSTEPVTHVLELNAGTTSKLDIAVDGIIHFEDSERWRSDE